MLAGLIEAVQRPAFLEHRGLGRVQVFGRVGAGIGIEDAPAEGDHPAAAVQYGEHHPAPEPVVWRAVPAVRLDHQPGFQELRLRGAVLGQGRLQGAPCVGGETQPVGLDGLLGQAPLQQILLRPLAFGQAKLLLEIVRGGLQHVVEALGALAPSPFLRRILGHLHAGFRRQPLDRFGERQVFRLHDEVEDAAVGPAAEAVIKALLLIDREGRRLFVVERTQARMLAAGALQGDALADHRDQPHPRPEFVQKMRRERHGGFIAGANPRVRASCELSPCSLRFTGGSRKTST